MNKSHVAYLYFSFRSANRRITKDIGTEDLDAFQYGGLQRKTACGVSVRECDPS